MNNNKNSNDTHNDATLSQDDEMAALLPFFIGGTLKPRDHARVELWINSSPNGHDALQNALTEQAEVTYTNETIAPPPHALGNVMDAIAREPQTNSVRHKTTGIFQKAINWLNTTPPALAWSMAAVLLLIAGAQTGILLSQQTNDPFIVAGSGDTRQTGTVAIIRFSSEATIAQITSALGEAGATIIKGPTGNDTFLIRFKNTGEKDSISERMSRLRAQTGLVRLVIEKKSSKK